MTDFPIRIYWRGCLFVLLFDEDDVKQWTTPCDPLVFQEDSDGVTIIPHRRNWIRYCSRSRNNKFQACWNGKISHEYYSLKEALMDCDNACRSTAEFFLDGIDKPIVAKVVDDYRFVVTSFGSFIGKYVEDMTCEYVELLEAYPVINKRDYFYLGGHIYSMRISKNNVVSHKEVSAEGWQQYSEQIAKDSE